MTAINARNTFITHPFHLHPEHQLSVAVLKSSDDKERETDVSPKYKTSNHKQQNLFPFQQFSLSHLNLLSALFSFTSASLEHGKHYLIVQRFSSLHECFCSSPSRLKHTFSIFIFFFASCALVVESFMRSKRGKNRCWSGGFFFLPRFINCIPE